MDEQILKVIPLILLFVKKLNGKEFRNELDLVKILNDELSPLYPGFPQWFDKTMKSSDSVFNVAYRDKQAIGVAIWKPKANRIAKLFYFQSFCFEYYLKFESHFWL